MVPDGGALFPGKLSKFVIQVLSGAKSIIMYEGL